MYIRPVHAELDVPTLHAFIKEHSLGLFTTAIPHKDHPTIQTSHIPFVLDTPTDPSPEDPHPGLGVLRGHIARANPQAKIMIDHLKASNTPEALSQAPGFLSSWLSSSSAQHSAPTAPSDPRELKDEVLVLFNAPIQSYVTAKFYVETKPATGKVVPTWQYAAVQVYGRARIFWEHNNSDSNEFLQQQLEDLTTEQEAKVAVAQDEERWQVSDAPVNHVEQEKKRIVGMEIKITKIEGRFKLGQEVGDGDWMGVVEGFKALGTEQGHAMARAVEERGKNRPCMRE
ncbi:transcriptional regulator PAI 2-type [Coprinopsis sp. MPI-PUGE-AT-0042]|nr:transcriptional regulator PAI 2-type [Coprinopsis sp. MPI-PUGE-AT-0042]